MSDPVVEAAQRAFNETYRSTDFAASLQRNGVAAELCSAAREAVEPIRELVEEARSWKPYNTRDVGDAYLAESVHDLLDDIAKLIYPSEELQS